MKSESLVQRARRAMHSLEELGRRDGVAWLSDVADGGADAVRALGTRGGPVLVITGGAAAPRSNALWNDWVDSIGAHASHALLFGASAASLARELQARGDGTIIVRCADLTDAAQTAERIAIPGATILYSPGCARSAHTAADTERFRNLVPAAVRSGAWAAA